MTNLNKKTNGSAVANQILMWFAIVIMMLLVAYLIVALSTTSCSVVNLGTIETSVSIDSTLTKKPIKPDSSTGFKLYRSEGINEARKEGHHEYPIH